MISENKSIRISSRDLRNFLSSDESLPVILNGHDNDVPKLTLRRADEFQAMKFDPADRYFDNGIFARRQSLAIIGHAGAGKSRIAFQLAASTVTGREFLGWKVTPRNIRFLFIQTENSNQRIKHDLENIRRWVGERDWKLVQERIFIKTVENAHDIRLSLNVDKNKKMVEALIKEVKAEVVVFDPLYAFAAGGLSSISGMLKTCELLEHLAKLGNPDCSVIVLHHSLAGRAGAKKATGFDRGSYGRDSKGLNMWARGQINIAMGSAEDTTKLVVSCGKNSNAAEFEPFGICLNPYTMIYDVDPDFDLEAWREEVNSGASSASGRPSAITVADLVSDDPLKRSELSEAIMEQSCCGKSTAYNMITAAENAGTIKKILKGRYIKA